MQINMAAKGNNAKSKEEQVKTGFYIFFMIAYFKVGVFCFTLSLV